LEGLNDRYFSIELASGALGVPMQPRSPSAGFPMEISKAATEIGVF
jgi:hypothetical protein